MTEISPHRLFMSAATRLLSHTPITCCVYQMSNVKCYLCTNLSFCICNGQSSWAPPTSLPQSSGQKTALEDSLFTFACKLLGAAFLALLEVSATLDSVK